MSASQTEIDREYAANSYGTDYSIAVLGGMAVVAALDWLFVVRKRFVGPRYAEVLEQ